MSDDAEVIVVGGGHNGMIAAAYLARAGVDTIVLDARDDIGGCASTVSDLGARFNICSCDHTMIRAMPIIDELELTDNGLTYLEGDASYLSVFHDRSEPWAFFADAERTVDGLTATHPEQADAYRRYLDDALPVAELVLDIARAPVNSRAMLSAALSGGRRQALRRLLSWNRRSAWDVLSDYFDDWHMIMPAVGMGPTVWGVPPGRDGTGIAALGYATRHVVRTGRPIGGSGALPDATRRVFEAAGGRVREGARVDRVFTNGTAVRGVGLDSGEELRAPTVIAACDPHAVLVEWLPASLPAVRRLVDRYKRADRPLGYESKLDLIVGDVPAFDRMATLQRTFPEVDFAEPTIIVSPEPRELLEAHRLRREGRVAERPSMLINTPSVLDPSLRVGEQHVLSIEVLFTPYDLPGGWPGSTEPDRWIDLTDGLLSNDLRSMLGPWRAMTPDRYESEFHLPKGYAPSYVASPLATLLGRTPETSRYRTPIKGLWLSGAATWPGAGIFGASGRNVAERVLAARDLPLVA